MLRPLFVDNSAGATIIVNFTRGVRLLELNSEASIDLKTYVYLWSTFVTIDAMATCC